MIVVAVLLFAFSSVQAAIPTYLNCTRYLEPCVRKKGDCCGYPFYDCISDGREYLCQSIQDFPELSAELLMRLNAAKDRGDPAFKELYRDVYNVLGRSEKKKGKKSGKKSGKGDKKKKTSSKNSSKKKSKSSSKKKCSKEKDED